jgi:hypothetical protein
VTLAPGETIAINAHPVGEEPAVTWSVSCFENTDCQLEELLQNPDGTANFFTAPHLPGLLVTVTATVTDNNNQQNSTSMTIRVIAPVEEPMAEPTEEPTAEPAETPVPPITLTTLEDGQTVPCENNAAGTYSEEVTEPIWPVVVIDNLWFPQDANFQPAFKSAGTWSQTVRFGDCNNLGPMSGRTFHLLIVKAVPECHDFFVEHFEAGDFGGILDNEVPQACKDNVEINRRVIRE